MTLLPLYRGCILSLLALQFVTFVSCMHACMHTNLNVRAVSTGAANASNTVIENSAAGGLLRVRVRARPLPARSAEALEAAAATIKVLWRAADAEAAAADPVIEEQLITLRDGLLNGQNFTKVCSNLAVSTGAELPAETVAYARLQDSKVRLHRFSPCLSIFSIMMAGMSWVGNSASHSVSSFPVETVTRTSCL
jgi:hypothetical protein